MNKELNKVIMNKSRLRNKYLKWLSQEYFLAYKTVKNKCNALTRKNKKRYFKYIAKNKNFATSKSLWNTIRHFITNKGTISDESIKIKVEEIKISKPKIKIKANWSLLKQMALLKMKVSLLKCSTIIM